LVNQAAERRILVAYHRQWRPPSLQAAPWLLPLHRSLPAYGWVCSVNDLALAAATVTPDATDAARFRHNQPADRFLFDVG